MSNLDFKPSELKNEIVDLLVRDLVPFVTSGPGLGKSAIAAQIAEEFGLELIDIRLSQCTPEDLMGLPMRVGDRAQFVPFDVFPDEDTELPEGKDGFLIFLDEFNSAPRGVLAAAYKIVYDRVVGMKKLHPKTKILLAGNREEDNAIVNDIGTALQSRVVHLGMRPDPDDFIAYAYKVGFDNRIMGFLEFQPQLLHAFNPDEVEHTFACPRTWEFTSKFIEGKTHEEISLRTLSGIISAGPAQSFHAFCKEYDKLPTFASILKDPKGIDIPRDTGTQFAVISMLIAKFDEKNFEDVVTYMHRMPKEMQVVFFRGAVSRQPTIRKHPKFIKSQQHLTEFFYADDDDETFDNAA